MNIDQLEKFRKVIECGTLSKAAEQLYISQPALSYTISSLEKETGCQLFIRDHNKMILTADGMELLKYAKQLSDLLSRANAAMRMRDRISLSANNIATSVILKNIPDELLPHIKLVMASEKEFCDLLLNGSLDAATCDCFQMRGLVNNKNITYKKLFIYQERLGLLVPQGHVLYDREKIEYQDILSIPLSVQADVSSLMLWIEAIEDMANIDFNIQYQFDHVTLAHVRSRLSCAEIRRYSANMKSNDVKELEKRGYRLIPIEDLYSSKDIFLWYLKENEQKIGPLLESLKKYESQ